MTKLRLGMAGGGPGAFIGPVHLMAARLDDRLTLTAGAFSRDAARNRQAGEGYGLAPDRVYASWQDMLAAEAKRADKIDILSIVTPNDTHFPIAKAALEAGFHVLCDKPATLNLEEALRLRDVVRATGRHYALTYTYSGYPLVREARRLIGEGRLGAIRKIVVEYSQGWLSQPVHSKQADWRADPAQSGIGGCIADIGVHAFHLSEFVSGARVERLSADLGVVVPGRRLDDDCNILLRYANGARGVLVASQIAAGDRNGLRLRVYGEKGGLDWSQEQPNSLTLNWHDQPTQVLHAGMPYLAYGARVPAGHPEGYIEAFATLYNDFAQQVATGEPSLVPGIDDGVRGMAFVATAVASSQNQRWEQLS
ncbi:Gfo/Idh/MocA family protein [Asticcacaulis sp. AC466]|uniref:Gfo/Idh/MocA family protein n=1 Tax=Asticcacaulis sp. AC466 TaxID=1282362 RepID=UPI00041A5C76|nr:Gfo/Idh/MocA family oxidoreductase [Asticcacaulis sp. AC466]